MSTYNCAGKGLRASLTDVQVVSISTSGKGGLSFCEDFRKQATPPEQIDALCFKHLTSSTTAIEDGVAAGSAGSVAEVSCASSTCSLGGNGNLSDGGSSNARSDRAISEQINAKLLKRTTSRHGRSSQRWVSDPSSHSTIRLTTGVVPICRDGNVLFVSASSKPAWIFPKGGWENDEKMEESALREAYEEAGILGILGPRLSEVQYETRKAKKRRVESEGAAKNKRQAATGENGKDASKNKKEIIGIVAGDTSNAGTPPSSTEVVVDTAALKGKPSIAALDPAPVSDAAFTKIRLVNNYSKQQAGQTPSIQSDSNYSQVRMSLFPLYVTTVKREWPESGRLRRVVPMDEAIELLSARPELKKALIEVKDRSLHLLRDSPHKVAADHSKPEGLQVI